MKKYCKAYYLKDIRQFSGWSAASEAADLSNETVVYLWDDLTVVTSPIVPDKGVLWSNITPEWQEFCQKTLHFEIPEDLRYAYASTGE